MRRLLRFLKLAEQLDKVNDIEGLNRLCVYYNSFIIKHSHYVPDNDGKTPNPWRKNMDYAEWENSPYFGSVSEFMKKFPGGIKDWIEWRRKIKKDHNTKWSDFHKCIKKQAHWGPGPPIWEPNINYDIHKYSPFLGNMREFMERFPGGIPDWIKWRRSIQNSPSDIDIKNRIDYKEFPSKPVKFPKTANLEKHIWSCDDSFKSILQFIKSQNANDSDASSKAVIDFIKYWKSLKEKK